MRLIRRVPLLAWILAPILLAALIAWPLGGWDTVKVESKVLPDYPAGKTFHGHRFDVALGDVHLTTHDPTGGSDADPGKTFLVVDAQVTNVWHEATTAASLTPDNLQLENRKYDGPLGPQVVLTSDGTSNPELNTGFRQSVEIVWTVSDTAFSSGDTVHFQLYDSIPRPGEVIHGTSWVDLFEVATAKREIQ